MKLNFNDSFNKIKKGESDLISGNDRLCYNIKSANSKCGESNIISKFKKYDYNRDTFEIYSCYGDMRKKVNTMLKLSKRIFEYRSDKYEIMNKIYYNVDMHTLEGLVYLYLKMNGNKVVKYYGIINCKSKIFFHQEHIDVGRISDSISKMNMDKDEILLRIISYVLNFDDNFYHGALTLDNIFVKSRKNGGYLLKLGNFYNSFVRINKRSYICSLSSRYKYIYDRLEIKYSKSQGELLVRSGVRLRVRSYEEALGIVSVFHMKGVHCIDIYMLILSICFHDSYRGYFFKRHSSILSFEYMLQNAFMESEYCLIMEKLRKYIKGEKEGLVDIVEFIVSPLRDGRFMRMKLNYKEFLRGYFE